VATRSKTVSRQVHETPENSLNSCVIWPALRGRTALAIGASDIRFAPKGKPEIVQSPRYTSTYVNRNGQWRMLALQIQQRPPSSVRGSNARLTARQLCQ